MHILERTTTIYIGIGVAKLLANRDARRLGFMLVLGAGVIIDFWLSQHLSIETPLNPLHLVLLGFALISGILLASHRPC